MVYPVADIDLNKIPAHMISFADSVTSEYEVAYKDECQKRA